MAAHGIVLRNHALVGGTARRVELPMAHRTTFEEGATLIFARWTALQLGVQNEWGGPRSSQKAQQLLRDVIGWFYNTKDHELCDLQDLLDEALQLDFNIQAEDDSPYQVARQLVNMHNQVAAGDFVYVHEMRAAAAAAPLATAASQLVLNGLPEADQSSSSDSDGSDAITDAEVMDVDSAAAAVHPLQPASAFDADGFQVVQRRVRRGRG